MAYTRKTQDEHNVQGNYGQGWEDVCAEDTYKEARVRLKEYRENEPEYRHRLVVRRVRIEPKLDPTPCRHGVAFCAACPRLEYLRGEIRAERISQGELLELELLADKIELGDFELLQWAGVPEFLGGDE